MEGFTWNGFSVKHRNGNLDNKTDNLPLVIHALEIVKKKIVRSPGHIATGDFACSAAQRKGLAAVAKQFIIPAGSPYTTTYNSKTNAP